jgi:hypothetical protein
MPLRTGASAGCASSSARLRWYPADGEQFTLMDEVAATKFLRGETDGSGDAIHMALEGEDALRGPEAAEGTVRSGVSRHGTAAHANVRAKIRSGGVDRAAGEDHG